MSTLRALRNRTPKERSSGKRGLGKQGRAAKRSGKASHSKEPSQPGPNALVAPDVPVVPARAGDHHGIHRLLVSVLHRPSAIEFQAQLEDPFYEPNDRLIVKRGEQVVAHAHLVKREVNFGRHRLPIVVVNDLVLLPELRSTAMHEALLKAIAARIAEDGACYGILRTSEPSSMLSSGWSVCWRHSYSTASAREILSYMGETEPVRRRPLVTEGAPLTVRIWRHVERAALTRLYEAHAHCTYGTTIRTETYWRWLISRRGYDRIYVAVEGPDEIPLDDIASPIVGYAVMREGRILELVSNEGRSDASRGLLARACRDAIEQDMHYVQLDAAPHDPLHSIFTSAGGTQRYYEAEHGEVSMVRFADPLKFLRSLGKDFVRRGRKAGLNLPCELGIQLESDKYSLLVGPRHAKLTTGRIGRSYLECDSPTLTQLLFGHLDVRAATERGVLNASTRVATETAAALFPQLPIWRPPWDESEA